MSARFTSFLVKLASRCNLDCDYCYVYHHADQSWRSMPAVLSASDRRAFAARLAAYIRQAEIKQCVVVLHGGEPLLAGAETIASFAHQVREAVGSYAAVDLALQTNGLLLTEETLRVLEAAEIGVSLSIDGPQEANDLHRRTLRGRSSFGPAVAALGRLKAHPRIFAGAIAVIDPQVDPEVLFAFFDTHRPPRLDFLLPDAHHLRPPLGREGAPDLYRDWLVRAFDLWFDQYPHLSHRTFEALLDAVVGLPSGTDAFGFGDVSLLTVESDGSYHDLDVLKVVREGATRLAGTVHDTDIAEVAVSEAIEAHRRLLRPEGLCEGCRACPVVQTCGGGSLPHRFGPRGFDHPTVYCREMLALIQHVRARLARQLAQDAAEVAPAVQSFDAPGFDRAEEASSLVGHLWADAYAEQRLGFEDALRVIAEREPCHAECARHLGGAALALRAHLATRPGVGAWQRAVRAHAAGRPLCAVDGSPLDLDGSYMQSLADADAADGALAVHTDDPWLRLPFGRAIAFEAEDVASRARPLVARALEILGQWRPRLRAEIEEVSRAVQFVRDPAAHPDKIVSFSDNAVPGALYVSVMQGDRMIDPYDLADSLLHEHRHQKLYLLERVLPMVEPTTMKVVSPWREDLRPPASLLHAVFVFAELQRFWAHVRHTGPEHLRPRAANQLSDTSARLRQAQETLATCPLTPAGRALAAALDENVDCGPKLAAVT
jgi:uncharacterized protein